MSLLTTYAARAKRNRKGKWHVVTVAIVSYAAKTAMSAQATPAENVKVYMEGKQFRIVLCVEFMYATIAGTHFTWTKCLTYPHAQKIS